MSYINNDVHKGHLSFGAEYAHFQLSDVRYLLGYNFNQTTPENPKLQEVGKGHEDSYNAFLQLKHQWKSFIFNDGDGNRITVNTTSTRKGPVIKSVKLTYGNKTVTEGKKQIERMVTGNADGTVTIRLNGATVGKNLNYIGELKLTGGL